MNLKRRRAISAGLKKHWRRRRNHQQKENPAPKHNIAVQIEALIISLKQLEEKLYG